MILFLAIALAAATVPLLGGSLERLRGLRFAAAGLVPLALALQVLVISVLPATLPAWLAQSLHLDSYAMVVVFVLQNRQVRGLWLVGLGGLANLAAVSANGGVMPAAPAAMAAAGRFTRADAYANSRPLAHPHLQWLGDIFAIPRAWPLANVFSIGDVLLVAGAFVLLHCACGSRLGRRWAGGGVIAPGSAPPSPGSRAAPAGLRS